MANRPPALNSSLLTIEMPLLAPPAAPHVPKFAHRFSASRYTILPSLLPPYAVPSSEPV